MKVDCVSYQQYSIYFMICLLILLEKQFEPIFRIMEGICRIKVLIDFPQMPSHDIAACSSQENALHLRIHPGLPNPRPLYLL